MGKVKLRNLREVIDGYKGIAWGIATLGITAMLMNPGSREQIIRGRHALWEALRPTQYQSIAETMGINRQAEDMPLIFTDGNRTASYAIQDIVGYREYARVVDNLVKLTVQTSQGTSTGTGFLLDEWRLVSNNHVIDPAIEECTPLYIENPAYIGVGEHRVAYLTATDRAAGECKRLDPNTVFNTAGDLAVITLSTPIRGAKTAHIGKVRYTDINDIPSVYKIRMIAYRRHEIIHQLGHVLPSHIEETYDHHYRLRKHNIMLDEHRLAQMSPRPAYHVTDMNASPGNSGGPIFNRYGEVVGFATKGSKKYLDLSNSRESNSTQVVFTDVNHLLQ